MVYSSFSQTPSPQLTPKDPSLPQALGLCHHRSGDLSSALEAYSSALSLDPVFTEALLGRGDVYMDRGTSEAREKARRDYCQVCGLLCGCGQQ